MLTNICEAKHLFECYHVLHEQTGTYDPLAFYSLHDGQENKAVLPAQSLTTKNEWMWHENLNNFTT